MTTVKELNAKCKKLGLKGYTRLNKVQLEKLIAKEKRKRKRLQIKNTNITNKQFLLGDFDGDKIKNIDDKLPLKYSKKRVEETKLSDALITLNKLYADNERARKHIIKDFRGVIKKNKPNIDQKKLIKITPNRTKTPISLLHKSLKYQIPETTDTIGVSYIGKNYKDLIRIKNAIIKNFKIVEVRDYYKKPKAGYKAIHLLLKDKRTKKIFEVQLKTERIKRITKLNHTLYKNKLQNTKNFTKVINACEKADNGNTEAKKLIDNSSNRELINMLKTGKK